MFSNLRKQVAALAQPMAQPFHTFIWTKQEIYKKNGFVAQAVFVRF